MKQKKNVKRSGCGFLLFACFVSCVLLVFNGVVVMSVLRVFANDGPPILEDTRVKQAITVVCPLLLIVFEWWFIDWLDDRLSARSNDTG